MKKWHIVIITIAAVIVALIVGGSAFYKYYIVPKYMEPVLQDVKEQLQSDDTLDELYEQAIRLHDEGVMDDESYTNFMRAYNSHNDDSESNAYEILQQKEANDTALGKDTSALTARYASNKVGVEIIQTNDGESEGKANMKYSTERTSDRIKAEDVVEAEKVVSGNNDTSEDDELEGEDAIIQDSYAKLKNNMSGEEFSKFLSITNKLDTNTLKTLVNDKDGLKEYLKSNLSDEEYKDIINLGYKYMSVLIEE